MQPVSGKSHSEIVHLNEKLSNQIKNNVQLLDNLNNELSKKERALSEQKQLVALKQNEVKDLSSQIEIMSSKMSTLVQLTKSTQETEKKVH